MPLSVALKDYLVAYGYSREQVESFTGGTRLLHDPGRLDDNLGDDLLDLFQHFNVDVSSPPQGLFTPSVGTWDNLVLSIFVDHAIATGRWVSDDTSPASS